MDRKHTQGKSYTCQRCHRELTEKMNIYVCYCPQCQSEINAYDIPGEDEKVWAEIEAMQQPSVAERFAAMMRRDAQYKPQSTHPRHIGVGDHTDHEDAIINAGNSELNY